MELKIVLGLVLSLFLLSDSLIVPPKGQYRADDVYTMIDKLNASVIQQNAVLVHQNAELNATLTQMTAKVTQLDSTLSKLNSVLNQQTATLEKQAAISKQQNAAIQSLIQKDSMYMYFYAYLLSKY